MISPYFFDLGLNVTLHITPPSNRVIPSPFSHRKLFSSQNFVKVPHIFNLVENSRKKWFILAMAKRYWGWIPSFFFVCFIVEERMHSFFFIRYIVEERMHLFFFIPSIAEERILDFFFVRSIVEERIHSIFFFRFIVEERKHLLFFYCSIV